MTNDPGNLSNFPDPFMRDDPPNEDFLNLQGIIVPLLKQSEGAVFSMIEKDPDHMTNQAIGVLLYENIASRLSQELGDGKFLRAVRKRGRFQILINASNGRPYRISIHKSRKRDYSPTSGNALKREVRAREYQGSLMDPGPLGYFIGYFFDREQGLLEVFLNRLSWNDGISQHISTSIWPLYKKPASKVDTSRIDDHEPEPVAKPLVTLKESD